MAKRIRVLIGKVGLEGHDHGAKLVATTLRDAGMEVIYTGLRQTPEGIAAIAAQEDVDVIGLSFLSGAHLSLTHKVLRALRTKGISNSVVLVGGLIPEKDVKELKLMGVAEVFPTGSRLESIVDWIKTRFDQDFSGIVE